MTYATLKPQIHEPYDGWFGENVSINPGDASVSWGPINTHHEQGFGGAGILDNGENFRFTGTTTSSRVVTGLRFTGNPADRVAIFYRNSVDGIDLFYMGSLLLASPPGTWTSRRDIWYPWILIYLYTYPENVGPINAWWSIRIMPVPNGVV